MGMEWKTIPSMPLFECTACGKIRRKITTVAFGHNKRQAGGKILSPKTKTNGYLEVNIADKSKYAHRLVAETWIGKIPPKMTVNHKDGNKNNNHVDNLEIVTYSENSKHAYDNGYFTPPVFIGSFHHKATTTEEEVLEIRRLYSNLKSIKALHDLFPHITKSPLANIAYRQTWKHI